MRAILRATALTLVVAAVGCKSAPSTLLVDIGIAADDNDFRVSPTPMQLTVFDAHGARLSTKATWPAGATQATFQIVLDSSFTARIALGHRFVAAGAGPIAALPGATTHVPLTLTHFSADADSDGIPDAIDNCPFVANADQASRAGAAGDACAADAPATTTSAPEAMTLAAGVSVALYRDLAGDVTYNASDFSGPVTGGTFTDDNRPRTLAVMTGAFPNPWLATFAGRVLLELPPMPSQAAIAHDYSTVTTEHPYDPQRLQPAAPPATAADRLLVAAGNPGTSAHEGVYEIAPDFSITHAPFGGLNNCSDVVADDSGSFGAAINAPAGDLYFVDESGLQHGTLGATTAQTVLTAQKQPLTPGEIVLDGATAWGIGGRNDDPLVVELGSATAVGPGLAPIDALYASFQPPMDPLTPLDPLKLPSGPLPAAGTLWLIRTADGATMPTSELVTFDGATRSVRVLAHGDDPTWRWIDAAVPPAGHQLAKTADLYVLEWSLAAKTARVLGFKLR